MRLTPFWLPARRWPFLQASVYAAVLLAGLPGSLEAQQRDIRFTRISLEHGLSQNWVNCIFQDSRGFMWFGTQDGLNLHDGYGFTVYKHDRQDSSSLAHNFIWSIYEDRDGFLWIGTDGGGLDRWNRHDRSFTHFKNNPEDPTSLSGNRVRAIREDSQGVLWVGTDNGLNRFDRATESFTRLNHNPSNPASLSDDQILVIYEDREEALWIGTHAGGLDRLDRETRTFTHYRHDPGDPESLPDGPVRALYEEREGSLWIGIQGGGLSRLDPATGSFQHHRHDPSRPGSLSDDRVRALWGDSKGVMWVGTEGGLNARDAETERFVRYHHDPSDPASLSDDRVLSLYEDRGGVLWVGTKVAGLSKWNRLTGPIAHFKHEPLSPSSLSSNVVTSFSEDREGALWVGTFGGGLNRLDRSTGTFEHYRHEPSSPRSLGDDRIGSLLVDSRGRLWIGTFSSGLYRFDRAGETLTSYRHQAGDPSSLSDNGVMFIREDSAGVLWIGTYGGGLNRFDPETSTFIRYLHDPANPNSLSSDRVTSFTEDGDEVLWIGTEGGGLNRFDRTNGTFAHYRHDPASPESLSNDIVMSIHKDRRGVLWIGTQGGGLNRWEEAHRRAHRSVFEVYTERDGLPNDFIYGILEDREGNLWLSTNRGLAKFDPRTETFKNYDPTHGLQSNEFNFGAYYQSRSGEMFFGGVNGFNAFDPQEVRNNPHVPPVVLTSFLKFNRPASLDRPIWELDEIELGYTDYVVSFEFAALDYSAPARNHYAYMLEGFDQNWIDLGTIRRVTFTDLDPGSYVLRIKGSNNDGAWNEEGVSLKIRVIPPPWKSWWAYTLYGLVLAGALIAYVRAQRRKRGREAEYTRKLEDDVRTRTQELAQRNDELEHFNRKLEEVSLTDSLTGLRNRRFVLNYMEKDVSLVLREYSHATAAGTDGAGAFLIFLMMDLDGYKLINDQHGHLAGDRVLVQVTEILQNACRASETLVRWGGDEFLVTGRVADPKSSRALAERIRGMIEGHAFQIGKGGVVHLTCSIGFACFPFLRSKPTLVGWEQVVAIADRGLYAAKNTSRNAWVGIFSNGKTPPQGLFESILARPGRLVEDGSLEILSSVPQIGRLEWGEDK